MPAKLAVVSIGGNSLIKRRDLRTVEDQYRAIAETCEHIADIIEHGWRVVITHGNGPQVGFIMLRSEIAREVAGMHIVPLVSCVADTQGAIGYQIQQALGNILARRGLPGQVASVVTQVRVDPTDPGFSAPDKPVGEFYTLGQLPELTKQQPDWTMKDEPGRGWRRVVPSPAPLEIVELGAIRALLDGGFHVVAAGGGGIPVISTPNGLVGADAVIDKDLTSSLLGGALRANLLVISTGVERVALNFATPFETPLGLVPVEEMEGYLEKGHFAPGSMAPKIRAAVDFIRAGGEEVIITQPESLSGAILQGKGTHIIR